MNELIEVPSWNPDEIKYVLGIERRTIKTEEYEKMIEGDYSFYDIKRHLFGVKKKNEKKSFLYLCFMKKEFDRNGLNVNVESKLFPTRTYRLHLTKLFSSYLISNIRGDYLEHFNKTKMERPDLLWGKFMSVEEDVVMPSPRFFSKDMISVYYVVKYWRIREPIISYIVQKIGKKCKAVAELKGLFSQKNKLTFDEYIDKKSKFLMDLDLSDYIEDMNISTEKKMRLNRGEK